MKIRVLKGVSGYRPDGSPYRYPAGSVVMADDFIARDLLKAELAEIDNSDNLKRPIAESPNITPYMGDMVITAVIKRGRKPKRDV